MHRSGRQGTGRRGAVALGVAALAFGGTCSTAHAAVAAGTTGEYVAHARERAAVTAGIAARQAELAPAAATRMLTGASVAPRTYYVDPDGDDTAAGTSRATAFRTLAAVNALTLHPGDKVLLKGGATFPGGLLLDAADAGSAEAPVTIGTYGGRASIDAGTGSGIVVLNTGGVSVANLTITGSGQVGEGVSADGVLLYADLDGGVRLPAVSLSNLDVSGFGNAGVEVGAWNPSWSGFSGVDITGVKAHGNGDAGISTFGFANLRSRQYSLASVTVSGSKAYDNLGLAGKGDNSGSGIELGGVKGGSVRGCSAYGNGLRNDAASGPAGIMVWDSFGVAVTNNDSHDNGTASVGGSGFAFQGGVLASSLSGNTSSGNAGSGFLVAQPAGFRPTAGNALGYNVSTFDGRLAGAGIELSAPLDGTGVQDTDVYRNQVSVRPVNGVRPAALRIDDALDTAAVHDNVFTTRSGLALVDAAGGSDLLTWARNTYLTGSGKFLAVLDGTAYGTVEAWRTAAGEQAPGV